MSNIHDANHCESSPEPVTNSIGLFCIESTTTTLSRVGKIPENVFIFVEVKHVPRRRLVYISRQPNAWCGVVGWSSPPSTDCSTWCPPTDVDKMLTSTLGGTGIGFLKYSNKFIENARHLTFK
uniref:(northern house mosquito) hypothetical protein n=1 Tax=Culex pipiens TaxID=7175 RepID=A0A8D8G829_CULPI